MRCDILADGIRRIADQAEHGLIAGAALFHVFLAVLLIGTLGALSPAGAAEPQSCGGTNLIEAMQRDAPDRLAAIEAEAGAIPNGQGLFWRVERDGIAPSYLLGTMHVTDPRVLAMPKGAADAFARATTVIVESDEIVDDRKAAAAMLMRPELTMFTDGKTIADFLKPGDRATLEEGLKSRGIPLTLVMRMKPWMIASFVALPACELGRKAAGEPYLDKKLALDAVKQGKTLKGLETMVEQLDAMNGLPAEFHIQALIDTLALGDTVRDMMETTTILYLEGRTGMIMPMMKSVSQHHGESGSASYADFENRIITERNRTMATRATPILAEGNAFMAVGALHLPGAEGIIEGLRANGFRVTAMN